MIFNLFKSKPTLRELIPEGFVDIHSHILPGIDDGAKNIDESVRLISEMKKMGFSKVIGTPHTYPGLYDNSSEIIEKSYKKLIIDLDKEMKVSFASEYMLGDYLISKAQSKDLLCLKDNYVLIEMSYISSPLNLYEIIFEIQLNGYIPVLAHPERYSYFFDNFNKFYKLKKHGCLFQLNLLSVIGYYGKDVLKISEKLIKKNLIDFVGTDTHSNKHLDVMSNKVRINEIEKLGSAIDKNNLFL